MKSKFRKIIAMMLAVMALTSVFSLEAFTVPASAASVSVAYQVHGQNYGWQSWVHNGETGGTTGQSLRMEAIQITVSGMSGGISYRTHIENYGWLNWTSDGHGSGSIGNSLRMEAIEIKLTGTIAEHYDVVYRVHVAEYGWLEWKKNGETAGTTGESRRAEAIEIKLVKKSGGASASSMSNALYKTNISGSYITCGFDGYVNTGGRHEGIDFKKGYGSNVYSLTDGVVTRVTKGYNGSNGLSTIAIYNADTNKTVIYLHAAPVNSLRAGQSVSRGELIATEAWRGVKSYSDTHTHVEVRSGKRTAAAKSVNDYTLDNPNPTAFWNNMGYTVK